MYVVRFLYGYIQKNCCGGKNESALVDWMKSKIHIIDYPKLRSMMDIVESANGKSKNILANAVSRNWLKSLYECINLFIIE